MAKFVVVVKESSGAPTHREEIEAPDYSHAAQMATNRTIRSGRTPGERWIEVTSDRGMTKEFHFGD